MIDKWHTRGFAVKPDMNPSPFTRKYQIMCHLHVTHNSAVMFTYATYYLDRDQHRELDQPPHHVAAAGVADGFGRDHAVLPAAVRPTALACLAWAVVARRPA